MYNDIDLIALTNAELSALDRTSKSKTQGFPGFVVTSFYHIVYVVRPKAGVTEILVSYVSHQGPMRSFREGEYFETQELSSGNVSGKIERVVNSVRVRSNIYIDVTVYELN